MVGIEAVGGVDDLVAEIRVHKRHPVDVAGRAGVIAKINTTQIVVRGADSCGRIGASRREIHHRDGASTARPCHYQGDRDGQRKPGMFVTLSFDCGK
jgi:hypothetical protein